VGISWRMRGCARLVRRRVVSAWFCLFGLLLVGGAVVACPTVALAKAGSAAGIGVPGEYCAGCKPPLRYLGGPVARTLGRRGLTVTPIYWAPRGAQNQFPGGYEAVINGFVANVAAASGADSNVFSITSEYYDILGGQPSHIRYHTTAGSSVVDTRPLPPDRCRQADSGYDTCVTDAQVRAELRAVLAARHLPRGLAHFYPVFLPPGVETQAGPGFNSGSSYCAYHGNAGAGGKQILYGNEPYPTVNCYSGQSPNGNPAADAAINPLSHELSETTTDPQVNSGRKAWRDHSGYEIGDLCSWAFGPPLGSSDPSARQSTEYNQVINGGRYYLQVEFSNYAFRRLGVGRGCQPSERAARHSSGSTGSPTHIYFDMSRNRLPADGRTTSSGIVQVWGKHHVDIPGDRIFFTTYALSGHGNCGTLKPRAATTDGAGSVSPVYEASRSNVTCVIVANDAEGGRSASVVIYQGSARKRAPTARATFPHKVTAGRTMTFTTSLTNPSRARIGDTQVHFLIFVPFYNSPNVTAHQVHLSLSWHGHRGPFNQVRLTGSTSNTAGILGVIGGPTGFNLRAKHTDTLTYRITVSKSVPRRRRPILQFQAFLDQINPASGADSVLAATRPTNAVVR
jgi:hypothetical protein